MAIQLDPAILRLIQDMNGRQLSSLSKEIENEEKKRKEEIKTTFGEYFVGKVGLDRLYSLPVVSATDLNLEDDEYIKYPKIHPSLFSGYSAVRILSGSKRPLIAIKVEMQDPATKKTYAMVEVIFKRYSIAGRGGVGKSDENNYVASLQNFTKNDEQEGSSLSASGGLNGKELQAIADLLDGKQIQAPLGHFLLKKV